MPSEALQAESELTYTPPPQPQYEEQQDFQQSLKDIISEIEGEFTPVPDDDESPESPAAEDLPAPEAAPESEVAPEKDDPAVARGMERLVQREVQLQAKEASFQAREAKAQALEAENAQLRAKLPPKDIVETMHHSPTEAIKALGHDPETVVRLMIAEQLEARGQPVPPELKEFVRDAAYNRKLAAVEAKSAAMERAAQNQQFFNAVDLGAHEYVKEFGGKAENAKTMPLVADLAKTNPTRAHREIMEEISIDARARMGTDPNASPITYNEAVKRVEARLADYKAIFASPVTANVDPKKPAQGAKQTPPQQKPPAKPLAPWQKKSDDFEAQGLQEAIREFHRSEAQAKAQRR